MRELLFRVGLWRKGKRFVPSRSRSQPSLSVAKEENSRKKFFVAGGNNPFTRGVSISFVDFLFRWRRGRRAQPMVAPLPNLTRRWPS